MKKSTFYLFLILCVSLFVVSSALATEIPGGRYKVGVDIPAGAYTIQHVKRSTNLTVWGADYQDYQTDGGLLLNVVMDNKNPCLEKVVLEEGNVINFSAPLEITKYKGLDFVVGEANTVNGGRYIVGEDIPAGSYSISITQSSTNMTVWGSAYQDYRSNGGLLLNVVLDASRNPTLGKVVLEEGNVINFTRTVIFEPAKGFVID